jgi:clan AA aspartic protease
MGITYTDIILANNTDVQMAKRGLIPEKQVRSISVTALVDTGSGTLVIPEEICQRLGLLIEGLRSTTLAGGVKVVCKRTEPITIHWEDRSSSCNALVMPGESQVLLGAIPLEDMDLTVNPQNQLLAHAHGDEWVCLVK